MGATEDTAECSPGSSFAISDQAFPSRVCASRKISSSAAVHSPLRMCGLRWFSQRSRHCLLFLFLICVAISDHFVVLATSFSRTNRLSSSSSSFVHGPLLISSVLVTLSLTSILEATDGLSGDAPGCVDSIIALCGPISVGSGPWPGSTPCAVQPNGKSLCLFSTFIRTVLLRVGTNLLFLGRRRGLMWGLLKTE